MVIKQPMLSLLLWNSQVHHLHQRLSQLSPRLTAVLALNISQSSGV